MQYFCPSCFAAIAPECESCPRCGIDIYAWERCTPYVERLIHALDHPIPEVRMGAIIALGKRRERAAAIPLARCAFRHPRDVIQNLEIVRAVLGMPPTEERQAALTMLRAHPARSVRLRARAIGR